MMIYFDLDLDPDFDYETKSTNQLSQLPHPLHRVRESEGGLCQWEDLPKNRGRPSSLYRRRARLLCVPRRARQLHWNTPKRNETARLLRQQHGTQLTVEAGQDCYYRSRKEECVVALVHSVSRTNSFRKIFLSWSFAFCDGMAFHCMAIDRSIHPSRSGSPPTTVRKRIAPRKGSADERRRIRGDPKRDRDRPAPCVAESATSTRAAIESPALCRILRRSSEPQMNQNQKTQT